MFYFTAKTYPNVRGGSFCSVGRWVLSAQAMDAGTLRPSGAIHASVSLTHSRNRAQRERPVGMTSATAQSRSPWLSMTRQPTGVQAGFVEVSRGRCGFSSRQGHHCSPAALLARLVDDHEGNGRGPTGRLHRRDNSPMPSDEPDARKHG